MGSSYQIYPRRELFASFKELDGGLIFMRDNHICRLVGKGIVRIKKMFDGKVRELNDMGYIPQMKRNLISLGALELEA